jgi:hypothetical protein
MRRRFKIVGLWLTFAAMGCGEENLKCTTGADCESGACEGQGCEPGQGRCLPVGTDCAAVAPTDSPGVCLCDGTNSTVACGYRWRHEGTCEDGP